MFIKVIVIQSAIELFVDICNFTSSALSKIWLKLFQFMILSKTETIHSNSSNKMFLWLYDALMH